jgi:hypothetical protein
MCANFGFFLVLGITLQRCLVLGFSPKEGVEPALPFNSQAFGLEYIQLRGKMDYPSPL